MGIQELMALMNDCQLLNKGYDKERVHQVGTGYPPHLGSTAGVRRSSAGPSSPPRLRAAVRDLRAARPRRPPCADRLRRPPTAAPLPRRC